MAGYGFETTHWSVVLAAGGQTDTSKEALSALCESYWPPLYAYLRHRGNSIEEAQDLVQEFFTRFLEKNELEGVQPQRGLFRAFLLAMLKNFVANEYKKSRVQKRGGGQAPLRLDFADAEGHYALDAGHELTPEKLYERKWALNILDRAMAVLRSEYEAAGKGHLFDAFKTLLTQGKTDVSYEKLGERLGMSQAAVKVAVHRLRRRYGAALRREIAQTVANKEDIQDELANLLSALSTPPTGL